MAEPIPSASHGVADGNNEAAQLPNNAEDRKAAAALNSLNANDMSQDNGETTGTKQPSAADQEALGKAMSRLEIASGAVSGTKKATVGATGRGGGTTADSAKDGAKKETEVKKKIKIASEDVNFLVAELDLSKNKATELLRAHDGSADKAIRAFITPAVKA